MGNFSTESDLVKGCFGNRGSVDGDRRHVALKYLFYYVSVAIVTNCPGAEHGLWAWVGLATLGFLGVAVAIHYGPF